MKRWEESITIQAPADVVFAYVSDFPRHPEWAGHHLQVSRDDDGPVAVSTTFSTVAKQFGTQKEHSTIDEMTAPTTFGWMSVGALGRVHHRFALSEDAGTTTLTKAAEFVEPTTLAKATMFKISRDLPKGLRSDLAAIKTKLEGSSA
jgi:uncharacterized membrane protein